MISSRAAEFLRIFNQRREHFSQLFALSSRQEELIAAEGFDELNVLLANKQRLIGFLEAIEQKYPHLLTEWRAQRDTLPEIIRDACDRVLADTESLLARLTEQEQSISEKLTAHRNRIRRELVTLEAGSRAQEAYGQLTPAHREINIGT